MRYHIIIDAGGIPIFDKKVEEKNLEAAEEYAQCRLALAQNEQPNNDKVLVAMVRRECTGFIGASPWHIIH